MIVLPSRIQFLKVFIIRICLKQDIELCLHPNLRKYNMSHFYAHIIIWQTKAMLHKLLLNIRMRQIVSPALLFAVQYCIFLILILYIYI